MAIKRTRNSGLTVPSLEKGIVGGDEDKWGDKLNGNIDKLYEFHTKLVQDSETQNQEIKRLDSEKVSTSDVSTIVEPIVVQHVENVGKPMLDDYMEETIKPSIDTYTSGKKGEIDNYVNLTSKPSLDSYEKVKESELNSYTTTKKGELDSHTLTKQTQLDNYEKTKETQLDSYTSTKQTQLDDYTVVKKGELDAYTSEKKSQLDSYEKVKEGELDSYNVVKKSELDTYEKSKENELDTYTAQKKSDLDSYERTKEGELDAYTVSKKEEITAHTDSEILRIQGEGSTQIDKVIAEGTTQLDKIVGAGEGLSPRVDALEEGKLDKGEYTGTAQDLKNLIDSKPSASDAIPKQSYGDGESGTSTLASRADHIHPEQVDIKGNSATSDKLKTPRTISVSGAVSGSVSFDGSDNVNISTTLNNINASKIVGGLLDISVIPKVAIPDFVVVTDDAERFKLTTASVQKGDTVKVLSTNRLYLVVDESKLSTEEGYIVYTAETASSVDWSGVIGKPSTFPPSDHTHTKSNITDFPTSMKNPYGLTISLNGTSQGEYDGSVAKSINITPSSIGAATSSHTHNYAGASSDGGAATTALACTGNSATATTLQTARTINGTSFNGSASITTANWGTARTITIGSTGKSVNGSANVSWSLSEIGAAASSHTHSYLPLSGGTISGNLNVTGAIVANGNITAYSDRRLKSNIEKIENSLEKIGAIGGYTFDMLGAKKRQTGVIAQEVEKVLPEAIVQNENGYLSVDYGRIVGLLIEGIKDLKNEISILKQEIHELKGGK